MISDPRLLGWKAVNFVLSIIRLFSVEFHFISFIPLGTELRARSDTESC